ncbi:hypothetical protein SAMN05660420_03307 [Desulfuromusa kysingii]|uniref:Uncharacterized protein n=1 Tax=Desulfuromusa kysingii TaxID=37625 RepID=A0A1H4EBZ8_9BACT|nr:hypothetical protein SAMN05660420_03307 [Desulfuromusa kysingii]
MSNRYYVPGTDPFSVWGTTPDRRRAVCVWSVDSEPLNPKGKLTNSAVSGVIK